MKRLYYLTSSIDSAESVSRELHREGVTDWNFHVMSSQLENREKLEQRHLHCASYYFHEHDGLRLAERGAIIGGVAGLCAIIGYLVASTDVAAEHQLFAMVSLAFSTVILIAFGVGSGMIYGVDHENIKIKRFHDQLENGEYLIMVDTNKKDVARIQQIMERHPDVRAAGEGHSQANPFQMAS